MKPFTESMRYDYDLKPDDLVLDVGGFEGNFAAAIHSKHGCRVWIYEPCWQFAMGIRERFKGNKSISIIGAAVGSKMGSMKIGVRGDSTGQFAESDSVQSCPVLDILEIVNECKQASLLKLNCEGGEFAILERIIECDVARHFRNIAVQFHTCVPDYEKRHDAIAEALNKTHNVTFNAPWCWEGFELK